MGKMVLMVLLAIPCWAFAGTECRVYENADLQNMSAGDLITIRNKYVGVSWKIGDNAHEYYDYKKCRKSVALMNEADNCRRQADRIRLIIEEKQKGKTLLTALQ